MQQNYPLLQWQTTLTLEFIIQIEFNIPNFLCQLLFGEYSPLFKFYLAFQLPHHDQPHRNLFFITWEFRFPIEDQSGQMQENTLVSINETLVPTNENQNEYNPSLPPAL